jgi:hypothetical protein
MSTSDGKLPTWKINLVSVFVRPLGGTKLIRNPDDFHYFVAVSAYNEKAQQWITTTVKPPVPIPRPKKCQAIIIKAKRWFF